LETTLAEGKWKRIYIQETYIFKKRICENKDLNPDAKPVKRVY